MEYEQFKSICNDRIYDIFGMLDLEIDPQYDGKENIHMPCPVHGGDGLTSFSYSKHKHRWRCWSHGCQEEYWGDIIGLVAGVLHDSECTTSIQEQRRFASHKLRDFLGIDEVDSHYEREQLTDKQKENRKFIKSVMKSREAPKLESVDERILEKLIYKDDLEKRGFSRTMLMDFGIGRIYNPESYMHNRIVIPIRNHQQTLVGFTGRSIYAVCYLCKQYHHPDVDCVKRSPKWIHSSGLKTADILFNMDKAKLSIPNTGNVILTEGPLDTLRLWDAGIKNAVAVFGTNLSDVQENILLRSGAYQLVLALDNDDAGNVAMDKIQKKLENLFTIFRPELPKGNDVGDLSVEEAQNLFRRYYEE